MTAPDEMDETEAGGTAVEDDAALQERLRAEAPLTIEQQRLRLVAAFGHDWIIYPARTALDPTITWMATRKRRPTIDEYIDGLQENLRHESPAELWAAILDQYHLEAELFELGHATA